MPSSPLDSINGRTTSGVACHHRLWAAHTVGRRGAWHDITTLGKHTRSAMSGVAWHHRPWTAHTVGIVSRGMTSPPLDRTHGRQCQAWHDIITFGLHTRSATSGVACYHRLWTAHTIGNVERCMTSPSLDSTHGRQRRACHDHITALGKHTRSATSCVA